MELKQEAEKLRAKRRPKKQLDGSRLQHELISLYKFSEVTVWRGKGEILIAKSQLRCFAGLPPRDQLHDPMQFHAALRWSQTLLNRVRRTSNV